MQAALAQAKVPAAQAQGMAQNLSERVKADVQNIHPVTSFANQMVPMMMVLASYVGAMIMGMNVQQSAAALQGQIGKWRLLTARGIINVVSAMVIVLVGSSLVTWLGGEPAEGFMALWLFQSLFVMTFMFVAQVFLLWFGPAGMLFNIILLSVQLVTSGAMVPRELLSDFYYALSMYLPATYAVEGSMNLLFGGPGLADSAWALVWIMLVSAGIGAVVVGLKRNAAGNVDPVSGNIG